MSCMAEGEAGCGAAVKMRSEAGAEKTVLAYRGGLVQPLAYDQTEGTDGSRRLRNGFGRARFGQQGERRTRGFARAHVGQDRRQLGIE